MALPIPDKNTIKPRPMYASVISIMLRLVLYR
jgi:hypothetical protein